MLMPLFKPSHHFLLTTSAQKKKGKLKSRWHFVSNTFMVLQHQRKPAFPWEHSLFPPVLCHAPPWLKTDGEYKSSFIYTSTAHRVVRGGNLLLCIAACHQYHLPLLLSMLQGPPVGCTCRWEVFLWFLLYICDLMSASQRVAGSMHERNA